MTKPIGFLRVPPLIFVEQIVWFYNLLISLLVCSFFFFFQYIFLYRSVYHNLIVIMGIFLAQAL